MKKRMTYLLILAMCLGGSWLFPNSAFAKATKKSTAEFTVIQVQGSTEEKQPEPACPTKVYSHQKPKSKYTTLPKTSETRTFFDIVLGVEILCLLIIVFLLKKRSKNCSDKQMLKESDRYEK